MFVLDTTQSSSVPDNTLEQELLVYPNPVTDYLMVEENNTGTFYILIFDANGKLVLQQKVSSPSRIDVSQLKQGPYLLHAINQNGRQYHAKFIKAEQ